MQVFLRYSALILVFYLIPYFLHAQSSENSRKKASLAGTWEAGIILGPDVYIGDLSPAGFYPGHCMSVAGGAYMMRQFTNVIGLKGQLVSGGLKGWRDYPGITVPCSYSFNSFFLDLTVNGVFNLSNLFSPYHSERHFFVYASLGFGLFGWNSHLVQSVNGETVTPAQNTGFQFAPVLPFGLGFQYAITDKIRAGVELSMRTIGSDLVDQYAGGFIYDMVSQVGFTVSYRFGRSKKSLDVQEYPYGSPLSYNNVKSYDSIEPPAMQAPPPAETPGEYVYAVQICAYARHNYSVAWVKKHYHVNSTVTREIENGLNRYIIGHFPDLNRAKEVCDGLRKKGIHDAWVIAYRDGIRHHVVIY
jgi:hypothetical protein